MLPNWRRGGCSPFRGAVAPRLGAPPPSRAAFECVARGRRTRCAGETRQWRIVGPHLWRDHGQPGHFSRHHRVLRHRRGSASP